MAFFFSKRQVEPHTQAKPKVAAESKAPAYERFHHLAQPVAPTLTLPYKYKVIQDMFHGMETITSMLYKRSETCTFTKLKAAVQQMTNK